MMTLGEADTRRRLDDMEVRQTVKSDLISKALMIVLQDFWHQVKYFGLTKER